MLDAREILELLPPAYREAERRAGPGTPMGALLAVMQEMLQPIEDLVADLPQIISPQGCPEPLLPMLSGWLSSERVEALDSSCERELIASLASLSAHLGTPRALDQSLRLVSSCRNVRVLESPEVPFHLTVYAPEVLRPELPRLRRALEQNKPAHLTAEIVFSNEKAGIPAETSEGQQGVPGS